MPIIYKTTNNVNGKIYIGVHYTSKMDGYLGSGVKLLRAVKKYGCKNFKRETLERCTDKNAFKKELFWIKKYKSTDPEIGYNLSTDGTGIYKRGGIPWNKGKKDYLKEGVIEKLREAGKSETNRLNHIGKKNGSYLKLPYHKIRSFIKDYNTGFSVTEAALKNGIGRKKGCNILKEASYAHLVLTKQERVYYALKKEYKMLLKIMNSIDGNKALLYYVSKIIAEKTNRGPAFIRRFLKKLEFKGSCKFKLGKINPNLFSSHNFSLFLKTGKTSYKRNPYLMVK